MRRVSVLAGILLLLPGALAAQQTAVDTKKEERLQALEERVRALEAQLNALKQELQAVRSDAPGGLGAKLEYAALKLPTLAVAEVAASIAQDPAAQAAAASQLPTYGGASSASKALNPDISVIGNFWGAVGRNAVRPVPTLEFHETEIALQAIVDPFARADFFVSLGREGIELEEGYLTFTSLPAGLVAKVGKMRAAFGKVNGMHNDALPWIDRPLVVENLVAGEEGINDAGLSVSRILPAPKGIFLEATGQIFRGDSENLFQAAQKKDVAYVAHLRGYRDITESTNVDLGFSYARGHSAPFAADSSDVTPDSNTELFGLDATFRWKPLRRAIYHSFLARTELVWSRREQIPFAQHAFGFVTSAEYRLDRRWTIGGRFDRSARFCSADLSMLRPSNACPGRATNVGLTDTGFSALLTYWPSEFSQIRGQYRFARYAEGRDGNELRFQFLFVLGAHGAHPF